MPPAIQSRMQASAFGLGRSIASPDSSASNGLGAPDIHVAAPAAAMAARNSRRVCRSCSSECRPAGDERRGPIVDSLLNRGWDPLTGRLPDELELRQHEDDPEQVFD